MDIYFIFPEINLYFYRKDWMNMIIITILKREGMLKTITSLFCTNYIEWTSKKERKS